MTDNLVTRLRGQRTNSVLCEQAADEIERLRDLYIEAVAGIMEGVEWLKLAQREIELLQAKVASDE
jgi:hypothetical protein